MMALTEEQLAPQASLGLDGEQPAIAKVLDLASKEIVNGDVDKMATRPNGHIEEVPSKPYSIPMHDQLAFTPRKLRVITVGAGFSGLMMAHKFQHRFPEMDAIIDHTIYEKRHEVGGTWLVNTYPGVQCDVPSHIYVSFLLSASRELCQVEGN